jgi:hypothetical protein
MKTVANDRDLPALVDAVVSRMVLPIPPRITVEMAKGFTLYMVKAVMSGRGDDLIDVAFRARSALVETDWLAGAAGFEPPHQELMSSWLHCRRALRRGQIMHAPAGSLAHDLLQLFVPHDSGRPRSGTIPMRRFESCRPSQPVQSPLRNI